MANTTFSGPVRSENGFDIINKNAAGTIITDESLQVLEASITVAAAATTGTSTLPIPNNFVPLSVQLIVTEASTNAVNITDFGPSADPNGYLAAVAVATNATGFKGTFVPNGAEGLVSLGGGTTAVRELPATLTVTLSAVPGAGTGSSALTTIKVKVFGFANTSDTE